MTTRKPAAKMPGKAVAGKASVAKKAPAAKQPAAVTGSPAAKKAPAVRKAPAAKIAAVTARTPVASKATAPTGRASAAPPSAANPPAANAGKAEGAVGSVHELMTYAYALEAEAAERYAEFAEAMENHNNREVAELFRKLARIELRHSEQILEEMGWVSPPPPPTGGYRWEGLEGPESGDMSDLHYLMQPRHALTIAHHNEQRAEKFFLMLAKKAPAAGVRRAALEMAAEETEHVRLIEEWIKRTPAPDPNWAFDPDPPVLSD